MNLRRFCWIPSLVYVKAVDISCSSACQTVAGLKFCHQLCTHRLVHWSKEWELLGRISVQFSGIWILNPVRRRLIQGYVNVLLCTTLTVTALLWCIILYIQCTWNENDLSTYCHWRSVLRVGVSTILTNMQKSVETLVKVCKLLSVSELEFAWPPLFNSRKDRPDTW